MKKIPFALRRKATVFVYKNNSIFTNNHVLFFRIAIFFSIIILWNNHACAQYVDWKQTEFNTPFGSPQVHSDSLGNIYVLTKGQVNQDTLIKYTSEGELLWKVKIPMGICNQWVSYIHKTYLDKSGNFYLAGRYITCIETYGFFTKISTEGTTLWSIQLGADLIINDGFFNLISHDDFFYLIGAVDNDYYLFKYDENGNELYKKNVNLNNYYYHLIEYIEMTVDLSSNILIGFHSHEHPDSIYYNYLIKYTPSFEVIFKDSIPDPYSNNAWGYVSVKKLLVDVQNNYYVVFDIYGEQKDTLIQVTKFDSNGNILWSMGNGDSTYYNCYILDDQELIMSGQKNSVQTIPQIRIKKIDSTGSIEWFKNIQVDDSTQYSFVIDMLFNGTHLFLGGGYGHSQSSSYPLTYLLCTLDSQANVVSYADYSGSANYFAAITDMCFDAWGNVIVTGTTTEDDFYMGGIQATTTIKYSQFPIGILHPVPSTSIFEVLSNPACEVISFKFRLEKPTSVTLSILNSEGKTVESIKDQFYNSGYNYIQYTNDDLIPGLYFASLITNSEVITRKFIVACP